ncbi:hypothetical protein [Flavobacterium hungaricum]|uniref:Uncharacterized protein n=1 Tax=Flavobacterium hungaricum TaxID=2082725 RepID=A0ABR9TFP7_9FLAO|nr:hypothetical protein [Flavobacterium hungaricum]MBE8724173.1 hypothetical protein [Flavobacterium hungaricum]
MITIVLVFITILIMLGIALFFKDNLVKVFLTNRSFVAGSISVVIIAVSYVILIFPSPIEIINKIFSVFNAIPSMLLYFKGEFIVFLAFLIEAIILSFIIKAFLPKEKKDLYEK